MPSIRERKGPQGVSYQVTVSCGRDVFGKKIRETATFTPDSSLTPKKRAAAVEAFARKFEEQVRNGAAMDGRKTTLKEFSERWLAEWAPQHLHAGTVAAYRKILEDQIFPALGHLKLSELRPGNLNAFFVALASNGARRDGKAGGLAKATIAKTRNVLSSVLRTAAEWEVIDKNPCDKLRLHGEDVADNIKFFTPEQAAAFLDFIEQPYTVSVPGHKRVDDTGKVYAVSDYSTERTIPEQLRVLFNLAIYTGMRKGELLALQWSDIDFNRDQVKISKAVSLVNGKQVIKAPKTKTSSRTVSIPHALTERLHRLRKDQLTLRFQLGQRWEGNEWLFIQQDTGRQMNVSTPYQAMQDAIRRYNKDREPEEQLPLIPFHGLRHTSATLLIASQQDVKTVSARLGHAQTSTTMNIYAHALQESDRKAADALEDILQKQA